MLGVIQRRELLGLFLTEGVVGRNLNQFELYLIGLLSDEGEAYIPLAGYCLALSLDILKA